MDNMILEIKNLKKYFPTGFGYLHAVDDVSFSIEYGKTLGIVGESGCGKSTLAGILMHRNKGYIGDIRIGSEKLSDISVL